MISVQYFRRLYRRKIHLSLLIICTSSYAEFREWGSFPLRLRTGHPHPPTPDNFNPGVIRFSFIEIPLSSCKQHVLFQISKNQQKIMIIVITLSLDNPLFVCRLCWNNCLFLVNYQIFDMKHFVYITLKEFPSTRVNFPGDVNPVRGPCLQTPVVVYCYQ